LNKVLVMAAERGFMFDGWREYFNYEKWEDVFSNCGITIEEISCKKYQYEDLLPWDNIDTYIKKDFYGKSTKRVMMKPKHRIVKFLTVLVAVSAIFMKYRILLQRIHSHL